MKRSLSFSGSCQPLTIAVLLLAVGVSETAPAVESWDDRFGVPDFNSPLTIQRSPTGQMAVGGSFSGNAYDAGATLNANKVALWDGRRWSRTGTGSGHGPSAVVRAVQWIGSNVYVGGDFTSVSGTPMSRIARWDGTAWFALSEGLSNGVSGYVFSLAEKDGQLLVGGRFATAGNGKLANGLAVWTGTGWLALGGGVSGGTFYGVNAIAVAPDGSIYVGGLFSHAGGKPAANVARWDGTNWSALGSGIGGTSPTVYALALAPNGDLIAGGTFSTAGGQSAQNLARWNGASWQPVGGGVADGEVRALAFEGNALWVGGTFQSAGGNLIRGLGIWSDGGWSIPPGTPLMYLNGWGRVDTISPAADGLYLAGRFTRVGDKDGLLGMARWDGTEFHALHRGFVPGGASPTRISAAGDQVMMSGGFTNVGGRIANQLARWDGGAWQAYGTPSTNGVVPVSGAGVSAVAAAADGTSYAGGQFHEIGGVAATRIARWDGDTWMALGSGIQGGSSPRVRALALTPEGILYVGGTFSTAGDTPANNVAMWNGTNWLSLGNGLSRTSGTPSVLGLAWAGDRLYAGGSFDRSGELALSCLAYWDGDSWHDVGAGVTHPGFYPSVISLAVNGFELVVGGSFTHAGGVPASRVARWHPSDGWSAMAGGFSDSVNAILIHGHRLFAGGNFSQSGDVELNGLGEWNGASWQPVGGGLFGTYPTVEGLAAVGTNVFASGGFQRAGTEVSSGFGIFRLSNAPPAIAWVQPAFDAVLPAGASIDLEVGPTDEDGTISTVQFYREGAATPLATLHSPPWQYVHTNAAAGPHRFAALVTDDHGAATWSLVRRVSVLPPASNAPPVVAITEPADGAVFKATPDRLLVAEASDPDGEVVRVDFYSGNAPLGSVHASPWELIWPNLQAGSYALRAVAWDNVGAGVTSAVVSVTVLPPNDAPYLEITEPLEGTVLENPGTLTLRANSSDGDGELVRVEFFMNDQSLVAFTQDLDWWRFSHAWSPAPVGTHTFRVVATDDDGAASEQSVTFTIVPFNQPPTISLSGVEHGAVIEMPNSIPLTVEANDADGEVVQVEWMNGDAVLASKTSPPWVFTLRNLAPTTYYLRARAEDDGGKTAITPVRVITVTNNPAAQPRYRLVELVIPGGIDGRAGDLNELNHAVATIENSDRALRGFRYSDGEFLDLAAATTPPLTATLHCLGLNDAGVIVGYARLRGLDMAFRWENGVLSELGVLGQEVASGMFSHARAINNHGWIVGASRNSNDLDRAFLHLAGVMTDLGGLDETLDQSEARAINDRGEVVGRVFGVGRSAAFVYDSTNGMRSLGVPPGTLLSQALGINDRGQVVGDYVDGNDRPRAMLWSAGIGVQLGTLGGQDSSACDMNNLGQIVGTADNLFSEPRAFLWQNCAMFDLNSSITNSNWELREAIAINNEGWIVGNGRRDFEPSTRAFLLIPEPGEAAARPFQGMTYVNGRFHLCVPAPPNTTYRLDASTDLQSWAPVSTNFVPEGVLDFRDPDAEAHPARFYRAVLLP